VPVIQVHEALGSFEFELLGNVPREVLDAIDHFDHIAVIPGRIDPRQYGDGCLDAARYVGVVRRKKIADDGRTNLIQDDIRIEGVSMEFWLGDEDGKGAVIEEAQEFNSVTFNTAITSLLPDSVTVGTIHTVTGSYTGRHVFETPRTAIKYVCQTMSTESVPVGYRVNNDATLDAGPEDDLFVTDPICIIMRKGNSQGEDMTVRSLQSTMDMDIDMEDFATRVVMLAESDGENLATGSADISTVAPGVNIYKDMYGNPLNLTKLVNESDTLEENADTRAELALREVIAPHRTLTISTQDYDIYGTFEVGDYIWVFDPDMGLMDLDNEIYIRGLRINPIKLRVTEADFPITEGYTVAHRDKNGVWQNLTDYIHWEEEQPTQVVIGDFNRDLTTANSAISDRTNPVIVNNTIPGTATWVTPFTTTNYLDGNGLAKAAITVTWDTPLNTDGTAISDGDRYELNIRKNGDTLWTVYNVPWGTNSFQFNDLSVATTYEFRVRAFDIANNSGAWSDVESQVSSSDSIAPSTPAAPVVAASTVAIQVVHQLGKSSGGTFNLESDLAELEVHMSNSSGFAPTSGTYIGSMRANKGMMAANVPAVQTFPVGDTSAVYVKVIAVDTSGNKSSASAQASTTALLVDDAHISDLTVDKVSAGTISANWLLGAAIRTANSGQRVELDADGLHAFDSSGNELTTIDAATGLLTMKTANSGARIELDASGLTTYDSDGEISSQINSDPAAASGDYLVLRNEEGETAVALNSDGSGSFDTVDAGSALYVAGSEVRDLINVLPRGVVAWVDIVGDSNFTSGTTGFIVCRIKIPDFDPTRTYRFCSYMHLDANVSGSSYIGYHVQYAWDSDPTSSSNLLFDYQCGGRNANTDEMNPAHFVFDVNDLGTPGTELRLLVNVFSSASGIRVQDDGWNRVWIEDIGPVVERQNFSPPTSGTGGTTPSTKYTKTYSAIWTGSYQGDLSRRNSNGSMYHGQYSSTNGNQRSMIGFNYSQIQSDLSGATINSIKITLKNSHWYYNAGGTCRIGSHNSSAGSAPTTFSGASNIVTVSDWGYGATKTVSLSTSTYGNGFRDNTIKGITIGPGASTDKEYYGYFVGGASSSSRPKLTITYTK
jgi:hypothetical protein